MKSKRLFPLLAVIFTVVLVAGASNVGAFPECGPLQQITCGFTNTCATGGPAFFVDQNAGGDAIRGRTDSRRGSDRAAVRGVSTYNAIGVRGEGNYGYGVYGVSNDLDGVYGDSTGGSIADYGVYGRTNSTDSGDAGVRGYSSDNAQGVYGSSSDGYGVRAYASNNHAVYGDSASTDYNHYGGWFSGPRGVYANAELVDSDAVYTDCTAGGACYGVNTFSDTSYGIWTGTDRADHNYGLYTSDNIYSLNYHAASGFSLIAKNGGDGHLEVGDLVAVSGMAAPIPDSDVPLLVVRRADAASAAGTVGVVETAYKIEMVSKPKVVFNETEIPDPEGGEPDVLWLPETVDRQVPSHSAVEGPVQPGGLMLVKVQGLAQVKVDASAGAIGAGDLMTAGAEGRATKLQQAVAEDATPGYLAGTLVGKALEPLAEGQGLIWVLVDLR